MLQDWVLDGGAFALIAAFLGGVISFLSPCVLPLVPPYLAFMAGTSPADLAEEERADPAMLRRVIWSAVFFVAGLSTVFIMLGAGASAIGQLLLQNKVRFGQISGVLIMVLGLHFLGVIRIPILYREARFDAGRAAGGFAGAYVIGLAFAFGWTPCIGPILAAVLNIAAQSGSAWGGAGLLGVYAIGLGAPFILAAIFIRSFMAWMRRFRRHMGTVEKAMGVLLMVVGLAMLTNQFSRAAFWLIETFPILGEIG